MLDPIEVMRKSPEILVVRPPNRLSRYQLSLGHALAHTPPVEAHFEGASDIIDGRGRVIATWNGNDLTRRCLRHLLMLNGIEQLWMPSISQVETR